MIMDLINTIWILAALYCWRSNIVTINCIKALKIVNERDNWPELHKKHFGYVFYHSRLVFNLRKWTFNQMFPGLDK